MKEVPLTRGYVALVDDADYERVAAFKWYVQIAPRTAYARRRVGNKRVWLHRFILQVSDPKVFVDHADGNGLNNQRKNLRTATRSQNKANSRKQRGAYSSPFKCVSFHKKNHTWVAYITVNGKRRYLGSFDSPKAASAAYLSAAREAFGEFAKALKETRGKRKCR